MEQQQQYQEEEEEQRRQQQHAGIMRSVSPELSPIASGPPVVTATFRSQRISSPSVSAPPLLLQQQQQRWQPQGIPSTTTSACFTSSSLHPASSSSPAEPEDGLVLATMQQTKEAIIGTIPDLPRLHLLERTAIQIPETTTMTVSVLLDRILEYLRLQSIRFECEANTGCLDCMAAASPSSAVATTTDDMVGFVIQLWKGRSSSNNNSNSDEKVFWLEAQRREGCSIAMNAIRRSLIRHVLQGQTPASDLHQQQQQQQQHHYHQQQQQQLLPSLLGQRRPHQEVSSSNSNAGGLPVHHQHQHKRQRSLSPQRARLNCHDALAIGLRLLTSAQHDQIKLGLESLTVLTNPRLVDPVDAMAVSRALVLAEGPLGAPLQNRLAALLQHIQPKTSGLFTTTTTTTSSSSSSSGGYSSAGSSYNNYSAGSSLPETMYHLTLHVLANALEVVVSHNEAAAASLIHVTAPLWQIVLECLLRSLDNAMQRPHEAALSAKCIRHLLPATTQQHQTTNHNNNNTHTRQHQPPPLTRLDVPAVQATVQRAHQFGKSHHKSLEQESQRLLGSFTTTSATAA